MGPGSAGRSFLKSKRKVLRLRSPAARSAQDDEKLGSRRIESCGLEGRIDQSGGAADPFEILVVVDAHHLAAPHADEGHHGNYALTFRPDVHDAHLSLRSAVRRLDDGSE